MKKNHLNKRLLTTTKIPRVVITKPLITYSIPQTQTIFVSGATYVTVDGTVQLKPQASGKTTSAVAEFLSKKEQ